MRGTPPGNNNKEAKTRAGVWRPRTDGWLRGADRGWQMTRHEVGSNEEAMIQENKKNINDMVWKTKRIRQL